MAMAWSLPRARPRIIFMTEPERRVTAGTSSQKRGQLHPKLSFARQRVVHAQC